MARHRRAVVALWIVLVAVSAGFSMQQTSRLSDGGWEVPGSQAERAGRLLADVPGHGEVRLAVFVEGSSPAAARAALERARDRLPAIDHVRAAEPQRLGEGRLLLPLVYDGPSAERVDVASALRAALVADERGATVRIVGTPAIWSNFQEVSEQQLARAELYGFPIVVLILLAAFGTVVACLAPLVLGVAAVVVTGACVYFLAGTIQMSVYVTNVASMIGIGVAVDYSLFVVSRFRRELRSGARVEAALRRSMASAGTAVVFSGLTVVLSLAGLLLVDVNAVRSIAIGAILVVSVAVLATATLLPALLALVGRRIERLRVRLPGRRRPEGEFWMRWSARVMRHPVPALVGGVAVMLALAAPLLDLRTENHGLAQLPRDAEVRVAMERVAAVAGPGALAPIHVLTDDRAAAARIAAELRGVAGIEAVGAPVASRDGSRFLVEAVQSDDPESNAAQATYERATRVARSTAPDASVVLGGTTAFGMAVEKSLTSGVWQIMLFVLAGAYLVLLVLLRSVVLPLKAVLMNLLSIGAAYGVLVAVFQWGWLDWTGYDSPGYLDTTVPTLVLAVSFGLSMDYEVFLLTRIRERFEAGASNERAVSEGLAASARTITAAAAVMVGVFGMFAIAGAPVLKELGIGLAVAVLVDATIVRLLIVPAAMRLMGTLNWWMPAGLARLLGGARVAGSPTSAR